jgi:hypothetical protein
MNNKTMAVLAVVAAVVIASTIALTANDSAFATRKTETTAQQNSCGNDALPLNILCQNAGSQVQGRDNLVVVNATQ